MNIYKMSLQQFQVNTKFLNSLPPEWSKFVTDVKLVRDLHTTNFHQLKAYLEQHDIRVNEVRIMRERNQDPLALVASHQNTPSHFNTYQTSYNHPQYSHLCDRSHSRLAPEAKRKTDATWFRVKVLLVKAQGSGKVLNEMELKFLANSRVSKGPVT
ncbi:hypothetical protein Tco_1361898 [Tanacetum coccineum]